MKKSLTSILLLLFLIPINFLFAQDFTYDNNGNLLSDETHNNLWDYNNRLTETLGMGDAPASTTYAYDPSGSRVKYSPAGGGSSTIYPTNLYEITGATSTKHIYAGEDMVGSIKGSTLYSVHSDHLTGSNVITNASSTLEELIDYYPYGKIRLDEATSTFKTSRKYTGHNYDEETDLNYMQARYQDGNTGRFLSQDPMFQAIGTDLSGFERTQEQLLSNPQELNSYSYVVNNPLKYKDPTGEASTLAWLVNPIGTAGQYTFWRAGSAFVAKFGFFDGRGRPISSAMMNRSLGLNPSPQLSINESNQKQYGNVIDALKNSELLNSAIQSRIEGITLEKLSQGVNMQLDFGKEGGDLSTAIGKANISVTGAKKENGYNLNVQLRDTYNFDPHDYGNPLTDTMNNAAVLSESSQVISSYGVNINFSHEVDSLKKKKKKFFTNSSN